ncbi:hydroxymethylbilane synthase [Rhodoluna sp.]|jgi:hydroxymethylbilane synthase|uniref:hydroxymethylbilane synthase n=1 Tax=Rhodoluna sp. TaxID=1969481 RepID=UPI0025CE374C|nr:hydroxymethylbilane synthase [Rhodoluna sp.]
MSERVFRVGTRGSKLALVQANFVADWLRTASGHKVEIQIISTEGDETQGSLMNPMRPGVFVSSIRDALLAEKVDLIVHSFKDLPSAPIEGLQLVAVPEREDNRDVIVSNGNLGLMQLPAGSRVGTSSPRREARINFLRPDLVTLPIRGNVDTRIQKLRDGQYDAIVLAAAGINRLGRQSEISEYLNSEQLLPAPAQGALAIEIRTDDDQLRELLTPLNDAQTRLITTAERAVLVGINAACTTAIGALAELNGDQLTVTAELSDPETNTHKRVRKTVGPVEVGMTSEAFQLGMYVARQLMSDD